MRAIIIDDGDCKALLDSLELAKFREQKIAPPSERQEIQDMHRQFHYHVTKWLQLHGYRA